MTNPVKAAQYLSKLEDLRCEGKWDDVPELVRKVRKHANDRACVTAVAETEHAVIKASQKQNTNVDVGSTTTVPIADFDPSLVPKLLEVIDAEHTFPQDRLQAQVCLAWVHWTLGQYEDCALRLPTDQDKAALPLDQADGVSEWTRVCVLKAAYLQAFCFSQDHRTIEALDTYQGALATLSPLWNGQKARTQLRFWAELLLTEYCMLQVESMEKGEKSLEDADCLVPFRYWAKYWEATKAQGAPIVGGHGIQGAVPRRRVWCEYYAAISSILQKDLPYPMGSVSEVKDEPSTRNQLQMELKKVETAYEALLLSETTFPRADEEREEVEDFVASVIKNWNVSVGHTWHEDDLGSGGIEGRSRGVLDILYRAATKTFHSTAILRHLFTVHLSVAEFDLAFHAFDSYMEIVKKGKARVDKTGHLEPSLDDDATVLRTISQAIIALCKYGSQDAAETARDLGIELEEMIQKLRPPLPSTAGNIPTVEEENGNGTLHPRVPARIYGLAWQAIGLSQAHWSRITFDASVRIELQAKAIRSLQKSLSPEVGNPTDIRSLFVLSLLLAEQRELAAAIDIVKAALLSNKKSTDPRADAHSYGRERSLLPLWHLLALLLSARQDYTTAARTCEAAFEQFNDPELLFGSQALQGSFRSEHLNEVEARQETRHSNGLVDEMDDLEKEGIMEVKMTQLALLELLEGPEVAVNASQELLVLYARLFGQGQLKTLPIISKSSPEAPKSSAGTTHRRGSIFGSKREKSASGSRRRSILGAEKVIIPSERPRTTQSIVSPIATTPTIEITKDRGGGSDSPRSRRSSSARAQRSESMRRNSLKKRDGNGSRQRALSSSSGPRSSAAVMDDELHFGVTTSGQENRNGRSDSIGSQSFSRGRGQLRFDSSIPPTTTTASGSDSLASLSNPLPAIKFAEGPIERQRQTMLIRIWLMIATFYRRAKMYTNAKDAILEAKTLVDDLQAEISKDTSGSVTPRNPGWGGRVCLEELIGDVQAEMGLLAVDEGTPYISKSHFEEALMHYPDHPTAIVGLSNILLDIYSESLLPVPAIPGINGELTLEDLSNGASKGKKLTAKSTKTPSPLLAAPLGLGGNTYPDTVVPDIEKAKVSSQISELPTADGLPAPYKADSLPLIDRLAARDRAYGLLSGLTKLGKGWNYSDAWFALARAHEESGQTDKAKEALWWCVELEEGMGVRDWHCVAVNGYAL